MFTYVGIDIESSCLGDTAEVVEISATEFDPITGTTGEHYHQLCRAIHGMTPEATAVNHITDDMLADCPVYETMGNVRFQLLEFINGRTLVGHNLVKFDLPLLNITTGNVYDTLLVCRKFINGKRNLKSCCAHFNISWDETSAHRAGYDVEQTIKLYVALQSPAVQSEIAEYEKTFLSMFKGDMPAIVDEMINNDAKSIWVTTKSAVKLTAGSPWAALYKESVYQVTIVSDYVPSWAKPTPVRGVVCHPGKNRLYLTVTSHKEGASSRFFDATGKVYVKGEVVKYLPVSSHSEGPIVIGIDTIKEYKVNA
jgi:DNA polymerase III epsilon subunit-like protein